jgi:HNH endonuclease
MPKRQNGYKVTALKTFVNNCGYTEIVLTSRCKHFLVHRLVATAFIPNPNNLPQVNHIDGDKQNNHVTNLEWCSASNNIKHGISSGLTKTKLKEGDVEKILLLRSEGKTYLEIASLFGIHKDYAARICRNTQRPTHLNKCPTPLTTDGVINTTPNIPYLIPTQ